MGAIVIDSQARKPMVLPPPTVLTGVLSHMFCNGGFLSGEPQKQKEQDWQFDEATQEKIAVDAHENKAAGKKGLGFSSDRPSKLGKDYKGSKKRFDDEDEDEEAVGSNKKVDRESDWGSKQKLSTSSGDEEEEENKEEQKRRRRRRQQSMLRWRWRRARSAKSGEKLRRRPSARRLRSRRSLR